MNSPALANPLDPWAQECLFAQIEQPHPFIDFAVVGLIDPWHATRLHAPAVSCLLLSSDRTAMVMIRCVRGTGTLADFWSQVAATSCRSLCKYWSLNKLMEVHMRLSKELTPEELAAAKEGLVRGAEATGRTWWVQGLCASQPPKATQIPPGMATPNSPT